MTTTTVPARAAVGSRFASHTHRVTFARALRSEWIKLASLRSAWIAMAATFVFSIGLTVIATTSYTMYEIDPTRPPVTAVMPALMPMMITLLLAGIIGATQVTGEYSSGGIRTTLTSIPNRLEALAAKVVVVGGFVFVGSLITFSVGLVIAGLLIEGAGRDAGFDDAVTGVLPVLWAAIAMFVVTVVGIACGYVLRSGGGAVALIVGIVFVLPMIASALSAIMPEWIGDVTAFLPTEAGQTLAFDPTDEHLVAWLALGGWTFASIGGSAAALTLRDA